MRKLSPDFTLEARLLPNDAGKIMLLRQVSAQGMINILGGPLKVANGGSSSMSEPRCRPRPSRYGAIRTGARPNSCTTSSERIDGRNTQKLHDALAVITEQNLHPGALSVSTSLCIPAGGN